MRCAGALSSHPLPTHAAGEVVGQVLEQLDGPPDLAVLFVTTPLIGALEDIAATVRTLLGPSALVGTTASSVLGGRTEAEHVAAVSLFAACCGPVTALPIDRGALPPPGTEGTLLLLADPFSTPAEELLGRLAHESPALQVIGGLASAGASYGVNRLVLDDRITSTGAVGVLLGPDQPVTAVVSQGCRPVGEPWTVTASEGRQLLELAGRPALARVQDLFDEADDAERQLLAEGLQVGLVVDEHRLDFHRGDFLVRGILGAEPASGALEIGAVVPVGATVQLQVRDASSADEDLHLLLAGHAADGALAFTCNGRGRHLFDEPHHDADAIADHVTADAVAGMFCAGEIGPVAGRAHLHGMTASIALFG